MRRLRGTDVLSEHARRIVRAVKETYDVVQNDRHSQLPFQHAVQDVNLPMRLVTESEFAEATEEFKQSAAAIAKDPKAVDREFRRMMWYKETVDRFNAQQSDPDPTYSMELHVLRVGDIVVCTNPFELFTEYGIRIKGRSAALQTFLIQLAGAGTYLPTKRAVEGGSYSAVVHSSLVGPEGGQVLVEQTVQAIGQLWKKDD